MIRLKKLWPVPGFVMKHLLASLLMLLAGLWLATAEAVTYQSASSAIGVNGTAISHVGAGAAAVRNNCGDITPAIPAGNVNDLLVALVVAREESATVAASAGWATLYSGNYAGQEFRVYLYYRIADGSGSDTLTVTESGICNSFAGRVARFRGVDTAQPFLNVPIPAGNVVSQNSDNIDTGTETIAAPDSMLLVASFVNDNNGITEGAGWSASFESALNLNRDLALNLHYQLQTTAGAKSISNWSIGSTDENFGIIFALKLANPRQISIAMPAGTGLDDVLIATLAVRKWDATVIAPAGWTLVNSGTLLDSQQANGAGTCASGTTAGMRLLTYYKVAAAGEPTATWVYSSTCYDDGFAVGGMLRFSGVDTSSPIITSAALLSPGSSATVTAPAVTPGIANTMLVTAHSYASSGTWTTPPPSMNERVDRNSYDAALGTGTMLEMNTEPIAGVGSTGTRAATGDAAGDYGAGHSLILRPAAVLTVSSINRASADPTPPASAVSWTVTFSASVTGVDATDFVLVQAGGVSGASITGVSGSGTTWTVNANTGSGTGTLGLNLVDDDSIINGGGQPLGGAGAGNGNFTGQVYTVSIPTLASVINTYYPGTTASVAVGATSIVLGAAIGSTTPIAIGDTLLIIQMQDASLNATNTDAYGDGAGGDLVGRGTTGVGGSGLYEYAIAASDVPIGGGTLTLACGTTNAYTNAAATGAVGQKKYQVIRVPVYASAILSSTLTASAWNGSAGGVLAFDVTGALTLNSTTVSVDGTGFRGGAGRGSTSGSGTNTDYRTPATNLANGSKGEGIAGTPRYVFTAPSTSTDTGVDGYPNGSFARGAPGSAGGGGTDLNPAANDRNSGGGGGANGGAGGIGGIGWCPTFVNTPPYWGCGIAGQVVAGINPNGSTGGFGGTAVTGLGATRLTLGGGGGAGTTNNSTGTLGALSTSGAAGGGIVMIRAGSMSGSATFNANGSAGDSTIRNDGSGGGGAGGAVLISAGSGMGGVTINVAGGKGGDNLVPPGSTSAPHGPGGGGGGGYALTSAATASCNSMAGANGVTYNGGVLFGAYGAMPGSSGSCASSLTAAQIPGTLLGASGCGPSIDHYELSLPSGGVTCLPITATVTACSDSSSPCTSPITSISGQTATLGTSAGTLGDTTVTFNASGVASTTLSYPAATDGAAAIVTLSGEQTAATNSRQCCPDGTSCVAADSCSSTFNTAGFIFSASAGGAVATIPSQVAGVSDATYYLRAVKTNTTTKACESALNPGTSSVNFAYECNDPTACYGADLMSVNGGAATTIARNNNGSVSSYTSVSMTFDTNGNAPFTFVYSDVGKVTLHASKAAGGSLLSALAGKSNAFVVKPYDFGVIPCNALVGGICDTAPADPGLAGGGAVFVKAGAAFNATVTARAFGGAATPSFGAGSNNGTETVDMTRTRVAPVGVGAADGTLGGTTAIPRSSFSNGIATVSDLNWSEVGVITLTATGSTFLGTALTATGTTGNIGRFYPDHFDTELVLTSGLPMPCPTGLTCPTLYNGFVYSGQAFTARVTARNLAGGATQNYDGALGYAKATTLSAWDALGSTTTQNPSGLLTGTAITAATFSAGDTATLGVDAVTPVYTLSAATTAPTDIYLRALDTDNVSSRRASAPGASVEGGVKVVSGRVKIANAHGSELLPLPMTATVQYYNGTNWVTSTTDSVTSLTLAAGNYQRKTGGAWTVTPPVSSTVSAGVLNYTLSSGGGTGSVDITATAPAWLPGNTGRATFGVYKGNNEFIYLRENY